MTAPGGGAQCRSRSGCWARSRRGTAPAGRVALQGPRHRAVLARLLVARGRVVPVDAPGRRPVVAAARRRGRRGPHLRRRAAPGARARPAAPRPGPAAGHRGPGLRAAGRPGRGGRLAVRGGGGAAATLPPRRARPAGARRWAGGAGPPTPTSPTSRGRAPSVPADRAAAARGRAAGRGPAGPGPGRRGGAGPRRARRPSTRGARTPGGCWPWRSTAPVGRATRWPCCAGRGRCWSSSSGVDPGPGLRRLETDILAQADAPRPAAPTGRASSVWAQAAAAYDRTVATGARARLESTVGLLRSLAVTGGGGLEEARRHRLAPIAAAEEIGGRRADRPRDRRLRRAGDLDPLGRPGPGGTGRRRRRTHPGPAPRPPARRRPGPGCWPRSRWSPGARSERARRAAQEAEEIARGANDPALLAFVLNAVFMQSFHRAGLAVAATRSAPSWSTCPPGTAWRPSRSSATSSASRPAAPSPTSPAPTATPPRPTVWPSATSCPWWGCSPRWYRALRLATVGEAPLPELEAAYRRGPAPGGRRHARARAGPAPARPAVPRVRGRTAAGRRLRPVRAVGADRGRYAPFPTRRTTSCWRSCGAHRPCRAPAR